MFKDVEIFIEARISGGIMCLTECNDYLLLGKADGPKCTKCICFENHSKTVRKKLFIYPKSIDFSLKIESRSKLLNMVL